MHKRFFLQAAAAVALAIGVAVPAAAQWKPTKPINLIVPWAAGGATDQVTRVTAAELEKVLGQKIIVVNQPGASGSIGTKNVWEAPKDGYTWAAGAAQDIGTYQSLGMLDVPARDWHLFLHVANIPVVGVGAATPYQNLPQLLEAMKARPGQIKVATAGVSSSGHNAMEAIARATGVQYRHVTYDGGNPAVVSTVSGETDVTTQLAAEQTEMIRGKRIRPLATVSDRPLEVEGHGTIEPISKFIPGFKSPANYFGIFIPKGVPPEVVATVQKIWNENIANNAALKAYAVNRGALFAPVAGDAALTAAMPVIQANAWMLHSAGKTKVAPDTVGIPKP